MRIRKQRFVVALFGALVLSSLPACTGQIKPVLVEHARSTRTVAETINKALSMIQCEGNKDPALCQAAMTTIADQAKALNQGATELERLAK